VLPFASNAHGAPIVPDDVISIVRAVQPQVLVLPAGLALDDLEHIKSIKTIVVVEVTVDPHLDWKDEGGGIPVLTWTQIIDQDTKHEPTEPSQIACQSFDFSSSEAVDFTQQVTMSRTMLSVECCRRHCVSNESPSEK
jgi:hypothetical protein